MASITSSIKKDLFKVEIKSPTDNIVIADEPIDKGGKDLGFSPNELLAASLAACTSATLRMYADRKGWDLDEVKLEIEVGRDQKENKTVINRKLIIIGNLDEKQKSRMLAIANLCPVHKILTNPIEINSELVD